MFVILIVVFFTLSGVSSEGTQSRPFSVGESFTFKLYVESLLVGYQTIEIKSTQSWNGTGVYLLTGFTKTTPFVSIFYRLDDKWTIFMEENSLLPVRVEKDWLEGKKEGYFIYDINQTDFKVHLQYRHSDKEKNIDADNVIIDLFSLIYHYRIDPTRFDQVYTFDFLEHKGVQTVQFQNEGEVDIEIPKISRRKTIKSHKLKQIGGEGIEVYISADEFKLPLKMVAPTRLSKKRYIDLILYIDKFTPGIDHKEIPIIYHRLK
jgi:hypothetical protein